jgi:hypothetical protein
MIESSIQENGIVESRLNFQLHLQHNQKKLIIVENIYGRKSSKVSICGTKLESNVMQKLKVDLIQYSSYSCMNVYTNSQTQEVLNLCHHLHMHETPSIRDG